MRGAYGRGGRGSGDAVHDQRCRIQRGEVAVASFNFTPPTVLVETVPMIEAVVPSALGGGFQNVTLVQGDPEPQPLTVDSVTFALEKK